MFLRDGGSYAFSHALFWPVVAGAVILTLVLERARPYRPYHSPLQAEDTTSLQAELSRQLRSSKPLVYWDYQNPGWVTLLSTLIPLALFIAAGFTFLEVPWAAALLVVVGLLLLIPNGGQRTLVTRDAVTVRWGLFGIRVLRLKMTDIEIAELHEFSPLRDFGGYGIRFNREMKAYYFRGTWGVKFTMMNGKIYLVGSDRPRELFTVVESILLNK